ncbi:DUF2569 family protein [Sphingomonas sp. MS122]|uniref:DUF2569 family protein n=1 Tax=Sphingomonas sp. MS122 TaxID=3412683 RepID=UPI003C2C7B66
MKQGLRHRLNARSVALICRLEVDLPVLALLWVAAAALAGGLRMSFGGSAAPAIVPNLASYSLLAAAPIVTMFLGLRWFRRGMLHPQPALRLSRMGRWHIVDPVVARALPLFGATGLMASLVVGILLNIPLRAAEFLTAMPALPADAPGWLLILRQLMLLDVVLMTSMYAFAAVLALRHVPSFPRFLIAAWVIDILLQIGIARILGAVDDLPPMVAASLGGLLEGNLKKVLISIAIWLPYLILSKRVNLTYRCRVPA